MKIKLLFTFCALSILGYAQVPINNYFSSPMSQYFIVDGAIDHSPTGANAVWSFGTLTQSGTSTDTFAAPTAGELADYPGTTEVLSITDGAMNVNQFFYEVDGSTLSLTGASNTEFTLNYNDDNALVGTYPLTFGTAATTDAIAGQLMAQGQTPNYTGTIENEVDAYGTLSFTVTGEGTYTGSVTRVRTEQNVSFSIAGVIPGTGNLITHNYYKDSDGALVFRTFEGAVVVSGLGVNETFLTSEALITNTLSTEDINQTQNVVKLYPNPVNDILNISVSDNLAIASVEIKDINGRTILTTTETSINTSQLQSGLYVIAISTGEDTVIKKFIKK
jgi:hypothetical protein